MTLPTTNRMRKTHIEEVLTSGSSETVCVLRLAWEAGLLLPLQQKEMSSYRPCPVPLVVRDTVKVRSVVCLPC